MKQLLLISLISFFALLSCKKYEENKGLQFRTVKNRLTAGWVLDHYFIGQEEKSLALIHFQLNPSKSLNIQVSIILNDNYDGIFEKSPFTNSFVTEGTIAGGKKEYFIVNTFGKSYIFTILSLEKKRFVIYNNISGERFEFKAFNRG